MTTTHLPRVTAPTAADICRHIELGDGAKAVFRTSHRPGEFLDALLAGSHLVDAIRFLAHGLGKREAVWWACVCVRSTLSPKSPPAALDALRCAEAWVYQPSEENRWAAQVAAEATQFDHPAGWAAQAAFWSGPSLTRPIQVPPGVPAPPPVPPGPFLAAKAVANALILAGVLEDPDGAQDKYRRFLQRGMDIARGGSGGS
jgi:uncharacterized protein DUF6931